MPAEVERLRRPLGRRDRAFLALVAVALLAAGVAGLLGATHHAATGPNASCVAYSHPNFTGGATYRDCGAAAGRFCRTPAARAEGVLLQCQRLGFLPRKRPRTPPGARGPGP